MNCFWIYLSHHSYRGGQDSWTSDYFENNASSYDIYLEGLYYIIQTITTVGYGDPVPSSINETIYAIFAQVSHKYIILVILRKLVGIGTMAYFQSNIIYLYRKFGSLAKPSECVMQLDHKLMFLTQDI